MASPAISPKLDPITGYEDLRDLTHPRHALTQFYRAFNNRDISLMEENWSPTDDVSMDNPLGGIKRGWPEIRRVYFHLFSGPGRVTVAFYDYTIHLVGDLFYAVGRERGRYESPASIFDLSFRTTRVYRLLDRRWRQVHHHGSIDDPSHLLRYQSAFDANSADRFYASASLTICSPDLNL